MGIIKRQAINGTILTYIAVVIGFVTNAILLPKLSTEIVGLINILLTYAIVISIFGRLGFTQVTTRLFSFFRNKDNQHNGFLFIGYMVTAIGFLLSIIIILAIKYFFNQSRPEDDLFLKYFYYLIPLVFFYILFYLFDNYYKVNYKAVRGVFLKELVQKLGVFIAVAIMVYGSISLDGFIFLYVLGFSLPGIIIIVIAIAEKEIFVKPQLNFLTKELKKSILSVGFYGIVSGATGIVALNVDRIMIESMLGLSDTGIYSIAFYFGALIAIPSRSLLKIASAVIAESWKNNDVANIKLVYHKSTINQFVVGAILLIGIIINLDNIFEILSDDYLKGKLVMILIGLAFLSDMIIGVSGQILMNSQYYKSVSFLLLFFVVCIVVSNFIFIPMYGITGAALATLCSKILFNIGKIIMVRHYFKLQPFNFKFIWVLLISALIIFFNTRVPKMDNLVFDIFIRSSIASVSYVVLIYFLKVSEDINDIINKGWDKLLKSIS